MKHRLHALLWIGWLCGLTAPSWAADSLDTRGSLRADAWSGSRELDDAGPIGQASAWARGRYSLGNSTLVGDGWLRADTRARSAAPRSRLRELYWRYERGPVDVRLGRQMIVWGRADAINPTDNLSPRDFTLLVPDDGDRRYGNEAAQVTVDLGSSSISALYFPRGASHTIPLPRLEAVNYVTERPRRAQWAVKWEFNGEGADGSVSYFDGVDPVPDLSIRSLGAAGVDVAVRNNPVRIFGADASFTRGDAVWRAEAAYVQTDHAGGLDFARKRDRLLLVAGRDWTLRNGTSVIVQALYQRVFAFESPDRLAQPVQREIAWRQAAIGNQVAATQYGVAWRVAKRWMNDALSAETGGVVVWPSNSGLWRAKLDYALNDHWHLVVGADYYFGPERSFFGQLVRNRLAYAQLRLSW